MIDVVDDLLRRLSKTNKTGVHNPCRICTSPSVASDLCDKCIIDELKMELGEEQATTLSGIMIKLRMCHEGLDRIDENLKRMKGDL